MERESHILSLIRRNPYVTQQELADRIGVSRSAVAGYVASLTRKGQIVGRAYVIADEGSVLCIGGANLDSKATGKQKLRLSVSNPVSVQESCGGVARNIAANLARLSRKVSLLTTVGEDKAGHYVLDETRRIGVDTGPSILMTGEKTGTYTALIDSDGEMFVAYANMDIYDRFTPDLLQDRVPHIAAAQLVIADTNLPAESLEWLTSRSQADGLTLFIDPISPEKAKKLPARLDGVTAIFPNFAEACVLANLPLLESNADTWRQVSAAIRERGVSHVFLTLGSKGMFYSGTDGERHLSAILTEVVDVTGAGDAFVAGIAHAVLSGLPYSEAGPYGLAASHLALQTVASVSEQVNEEKLTQVVTHYTLEGSDPH